MPKSDDRFYLMEMRNRPVMYGDIGSLIRIQGLIVGGGGAMAALTLPGVAPELLSCGNVQVYSLTDEEWSDYIHRSDDPEILVGTPKIFQRKIRYEISGAVQQKVWAADGFKCMYCGKKMGDVLMTIDHFIPLEGGGVNNVKNYLSACKPCNKNKGSQEPSQWLKLDRYRELLEYLHRREIK